MLTVPRLFLAALRHNENATGSKPAGCGRLSCSPPACQSDVACQLKVSAQAVSVRHAPLEAGRTEALAAAGRVGPAPSW
jgi:hypothetical protein